MLLVVPKRFALCTGPKSKSSCRDDSLTCVLEFFRFAIESKSAATASDLRWSSGTMCSCWFSNLELAEGWTALRTRETTPPVRDVRGLSLPSPSKVSSWKPWAEEAARGLRCTGVSSRFQWKPDAFFENVGCVCRKWPTFSCLPLSFRAGKICGFQASNAWSSPFLVWFREGVGSRSRRESGNAEGPSPFVWISKGWVCWREAREEERSVEGLKNRLFYFEVKRRVRKLPPRPSVLSALSLLMVIPRGPTHLILHWPEWLSLTPRSSWLFLQGGPCLGACGRGRKCVIMVCDTALKVSTTTVPPGVACS